MSWVETYVKKNLSNLKKENLYRSLKKPKGIDFCSNDYLGFSSHPKIRKHLIQALKKKCSIGSGASRLIRGKTKDLIKIENSLKSFVRREALLLFSSGYLANVGVLSFLCKNSLIFSDELNHASLIDGIRLSQGRCFIYSHKDLYDLERKLKKVNRKDRKIIVTESLFSMDGDFAPLEGLIYLSKKYQSFLYVDEAHATGLFGVNGGGLLSQFLNKHQISNQNQQEKKRHFKYHNILSLHTFGKALGSQGAFVACSGMVQKYLLNHTRSFIFSTAPSPLLIKTWEATLAILKEEPKKIKDVKGKSHFFRENLKKIGFSTPSESQIVPLILGESKKALAWSKALERKNFDIRAIRYPTVPKGSARLRICIHSNHKKKDLLLILNHLKRMKKSPK